MVRTKHLFGDDPEVPSTVVRRNFIRPLLAQAQMMKAANESRFWDDDERLFNVLLRCNSG